MAEFPALPLFTDAYLGDTTHLTTFEHGAYLLLLIVSWRTAGCCLPDDDALLARYSRTTRDKWQKLRPILSPFFRIHDGHWHQARLQDEFQHLQSRKEQQSEAGSASARAKALKRRNRGSTSVGNPLQRNVNGSSTPTPTPITSSKEEGVPPIDITKAIFEIGVTLLAEAGHDPRAARSIVGRWRKDHSDAAVLEALLRCQAQRISNPVEWMPKALAGTKAQSTPADFLDYVSEKYRATG